MTSGTPAPADTARATDRPSLGGRIGLSLFLLPFAGMGLLFVALVLRDALADLETWRFAPAQATVLSSEVVATGDDEAPYRLEIRYRYVVEGRELVGDRTARRELTSASYDKLERTARRFPPGLETICHVDPSRLEQAVLERRMPASLLVVPLPLVFVAFGAGGIYAVWCRSRSGERALPIAAGARGRLTGRRLALALGALFTAVGGALLIAIGVLPAARLAAAARWTEVPCTILSSTVRAHDSDDGTTYRVDVLYEYVVDGLVHRSNRFDFLGFASSGRATKAATVARYPSGATASCWVDPRDPYRSVLDRSVRPAYLVGLAPLLFVVPGLVVMRWALAGAGSPAVPRGTPRSSLTGHSPGAVRTLRAKVSPPSKLLGALILALLWNGIVSVFVWQAVEGWRRGEPDWFLTIFLTPFVLVGAVTLLLVVHSALAVANPRPRIEIDPAVIHLGDRLLIRWSFAGPAARIDRLEIVVEGREEAERSDSDGTSTVRSPFTRLDVFAADGAAAGEPGSASVQIPEDVMHSLDAPHHRIVWALKLTGSIPAWPDVDEEYPLEVLPCRLEAAPDA